jgi:hypothetical protein
LQEQERAASAALLLLAKEVGDSGADVLHHQVEVRAGRVADELVETDDERDIVARRTEQHLTEHNRVPRTRRDSMRSDLNTLLPSAMISLQAAQKVQRCFTTSLTHQGFSLYHNNLHQHIIVLYYLFLKILGYLHHLK